MPTTSARKSCIACGERPALKGSRLCSPCRHQRYYDGDVRKQARYRSSSAYREHDAFCARSRAKCARLRSERT